MVIFSRQTIKSHCKILMTNLMLWMQYSQVFSQLKTGLFSFLSFLSAMMEVARLCKPWLPTCFRKLILVPLAKPRSNNCQTSWVKKSLKHNCLTKWSRLKALMSTSCHELMNLKNKWETEALTHFSLERFTKSFVRFWVRKSHLTYWEKTWNSGEPSEKWLAY